MPAPDFQEASPSSFGFSIFSRRRDQIHIHPMESAHDAISQQQLQLEAFQRRIKERFQLLAEGAGSAELLSIPWICKLLDIFIDCQDEFREIALNNKGDLNRPPVDKHASFFFDTSIKALDVCNAIRDGIEQMRQWQKHLEIVIYALGKKRSIGEGQFRRAKKALADLAIAMLDEKDSNTALAYRNQSFGRAHNQRKDQKSLGYLRSLSWSVSRSWSAAKQLQSISSNLPAPRANETLSTHGLNVSVFTMNFMLLFVIWALVAAIPCQDRGLQMNVSVTRQYLWGISILSLHEKILEESRRKDRRNACGLLKEIHDIEKFAQRMNELTDSIQFPLTEGKEREVEEQVEEGRQVYGAIKDGLDPLESRVREVFRRLVQSRTEGLDSIGQSK